MNDEKTGFSLIEGGIIKAISGVAATSPVNTVLFESDTSLGFSPDKLYPPPV